MNTQALQTALALIGTRQQIVVDRPLHSKHPRYSWHYPVNYGEVVGVLSGDGMNMDAYILDVQIPIDVASAKVIGVLQRLDDDDPKLLVCIGDAIPEAGDIEALLKIPEQWFAHKLHLQRERLPKEPFFSV